MTKDEKRAQQYAKMVRKWSPALRMSGERLVESRRGQYRDVLDRNGLGEYYHQFESLASKSRLEDRDRASRESHRRRYERAYGRR